MIIVIIIIIIIIVKNTKISNKYGKHLNGQLNCFCLHFTFNYRSTNSTSAHNFIVSFLNKQLFSYLRTL